ncbi:hypothetical protein DHX103_06170 [Planococcus sp. X10-3]|uniref:hypothetical protein n=1 Tax=Planococcus sp. X10-3 TaxID=3061240 RepID=UPI003BAEABEB
MGMLRLLDDLLGGVVDVFKLIGYYFAGALIVTGLIYGIVFIIEKITHYFY